MDDHIKSKEPPEDAEIHFLDFSVLLERINAIKPVPDIRHVKKAAEFISMAERFSKEFGIEAEIQREEAQVSLWLYFSDLIISEEVKERLTELIGFADEMMIIPRPKNKKDCEFALTLDYLTHHIYLNGEDLHPF
jgi:hypothetical protein